MKPNSIHIYYFLIFIVFVTFSGYLYNMQVKNGGYFSLAEKNYVKQIVEIPCRGNIYDRNGKILADNINIFELCLSFSGFSKNKFEDFCKEFQVEEKKKNELLQILKKNKQPLFIKNLSKSEWDSLQERLVFYPFISVSIKKIRHYHYNSLSHVIGYLSEINSDDLETKKNLSENYVQGDLIGASGLEYSYESKLKGSKGISYKVADVRGRVKENYANGNLDTMALEGEELITTIDLDLQEYCSKLLKGKIGCIIAIEPESGEILALVSAPDYDANYFSNKNFQKIIEIGKNPDRPLYNRATNAKYAPGSIFKIVQSAIALHLKVIDQNAVFRCDKEYINCHHHPPIMNLAMAIQHSCNPYFGSLFKKMIEGDNKKNKYQAAREGLKIWEKEIAKFGFGKKTELDIPYENCGFVPNTAFYDRIHGYKAWKESTIRSLDIGQGELLLTPIQMLNIAVIVANKGFYNTPHLVKGLNVLKFQLDYDKKIFDYITVGMEGSVLSGNSQRANVPGLYVCAKTGTVQNPHGADHSTTIGFAPKDTPKIAVAVYVENSGWGGRAGSAIAGLVIEYYLNKKIKRKYMEDFVLAGNFLY